ncbi:histidine phosphatase family protein, partial [Candidatus Thorarchaeota archaeon]
MRIIFLRHAETRVESHVPSSEWSLSTAGQHSAEKLAETGVFDDIDSIVSSDEKKALQTAEPFCARLELEPIEEQLFRELDRGSVNLPSSEEYSNVVRWALTDLDTKYFDWETARSALNRVQVGVLRIENGFKENTVLVVSHGIVLSLFFANRLGELDKVYERWVELDFLDYGIVMDGLVTRD